MAVRRPWSSSTRSRTQPHPASSGRAWRLSFGIKEHRGGTPSLRSLRVAVTVEHLAELAEQRHRDPTAVWHQACDLLAETSTPDVEAPLRWVLGLAFHELGRMAEA